MNKLPISFAPLQGYTEDVYRRFHQKVFGGVTEYYSPFVRIEHGKVRSKDLRDINPENNAGVPLIPQLMVGNAKDAEELIRQLPLWGVGGLDLNMGCPFTLQTRHGKGAGILTQPDKVREIMEVVKAHTEICFSVKMRLGLESADDWKEILPILNSAPLRHITIHPRTANQEYGGEVNMRAFEEFISQCKHPVIYNGDVRSVESIEKLQTTYPTLAGIMIGRGLLARPSLAHEYTSGTTMYDKTLLRKVQELHSLILDQYTRIIPNEQQLLMKVRTFWDFYEPTGTDSLLDKKSWKKIKKAGNMKNYMEAVRNL